MNMFITKKHISRRTFVRGSLGAAIALPFLDAMVPALSAAPTAPFRFGAVYLPNGVYPDTWHPDAAGSDFVFKPVMQPLEPFRNQLVTVMTNVSLGLIEPSRREFIVPERNRAGCRR